MILRRSLAELTRRSTRILLYSIKLFSLMEKLTEELSKQLLNSEWLVKVDSIKAIPYLFKYVSSSADLSSCIIFTDTKSVWVEVLNSKSLARRWRALNPLSPEPHNNASDEDYWREQILELLSNAHTMGGIIDLSFEIVDSNFSDMAFEIECQAFKWRWETCFIGHQLSSEIISKHLIFPLISFSHLASSSTEPVSELTDSDLEKSVDKLARTARRTVDNHIKNALSKPRVASSIRRMSAMFNFIPDLKPVVSVAEIPLLEVPKVTKTAPSTSSMHLDRKGREDGEANPRSLRNEMPRSPVKKIVRQERENTVVHPQPLKNEEPLPPSPVRTAQKRERTAEPQISLPVADSETEDEDEDESAQTKNNKIMDVSPGLPSTSEPPRPASTSNDQTSFPGGAQKSQSPSDPDPIPRPIKKAKPSTDDSDSDSDKKASRSNSTAPRQTVARGTRQPIKRGGKRF